MLTIAGGVILGLFGFFIVCGLLASIHAGFVALDEMLAGSRKCEPVQYSRTWLDDTRDIHNIR